MGRFISAAVLREMAKNDKAIVLAEDSVLTPSAKDLAKELGISITKGKQEIVSPRVGKSKWLTTHEANKALSLRETQDTHQISDLKDIKDIKDIYGTSETSILKDELKNVVQKILGEVLKPACENPRATHVKGENVIIQPFAEAPTGQKIGLVDVIDARVGNLCSGFMTFDHSKLPWFLNYDEVDYIIEGDFVLEVEDKVFRAKAGDVVYIPKGSKVVFSSPTSQSRASSHWPKT